MTDFKRILVPVDFSECSRVAVRQAIDLAQKYGATLELFHAYEPPYYVGDVLIQIPDKPALSVHDYIRQSAQKLLDEMLAGIEGLDQVPYTSDLIAGVPADAILEKCQGADYDLIIMGTHGRRGLSHLLMGSVAERVIRQASCPVLVLRDAYPAR
ncbi:MAG: universal stress protein [Myxococcales bacterium]|nr:universal stress protein [Myxococcales bacterium]MCB9523628.1 universal stress protein [Myxococcales bacterium]